MSDIYGYSERLESAKRRLSRYECSRLLLGFLDHMVALGLSTGRVAKYANHISALMRNVVFDPVKATRSDVERVVAWINSQPYKSSTKGDLRLTVRKLVQYAKFGSCGKKTPLPVEVSWFPVKGDGKDVRVTPESLLTLDELNAMLGSAENERDRALVTVLFEAALRPGELLNMKVGSVEFMQDYCLIAVAGKTGTKRIPLVVSYKPLLEWLEKHPKRSDHEAPLWASIGNNSKGEAMGYHYFRKILKRLAEKAGVRKDVWPYLFRHSSLTALAKVFTESRLELYAGWVQGSKMARRYVHFSARDLEEAVLELHGLRKDEKAEVVLKLAECPRCGSRSQPDSVRCSFCGLILDREAAAKTEQEKVMREKEIVKRLERLERAVSSLLEAQNGTP